MRALVQRFWIALFVVGAWVSCSGQSGAFGAPVGEGAVGYRVEWASDLTRSWPVPESSGHLLPSPRWVRVHIWYPAVAGTGAAMKFRDYMEVPRPQLVPQAVADAIHANDFGNATYSFRGIYRSDESRFREAMATSVAARSWADPAAGKFPVVIYSLGQNDFTQDAVSLAEFLASNGYIVATVPQLGTSARRTLLFVHDPLSYETQLRDLEVALAKVLKLKSADEQRVVAVGHSYGGIYALLLAMRSNSIAGVIGLDPSYIAQRPSFAYDLRKFPFFEADLRVPIVTLRRSSVDMDRSLLDSFAGAERLEIVYPDLMHGDFATVVFLKRDLPNELQMAEETKVRSPRTAAEGASVAFHQVLLSLGHILSGQQLDGGVFASDSVRRTVVYTAGAPAPSHEELYWICKLKGLTAAEKAVTAAKSTGTVFDESRVITIAKELGYSNQAKESLDMFRLVAFAFPESIKAQLAAAEALMDAGFKDEARPMLQKVLQLDPKNQPAKDALTHLGG